MRKEVNDDLFYDNEELLKRDSYDIGKKEGIEQTKVETAKKLLLKEFSLEEISEITGLSIEEIENIK